MTDPSILSERLRQFEKEASDRFHEHGKHISRIEGVMEERTRALAETDRDLRDEVSNVSEKIEKVEQRLTGKIEGLAASVGNLSNSVVKQGVYIGLGAAVGAAVFSVLIQRIVNAVPGT